MSIALRAWSVKNWKDFSVYWTRLRSHFDSVVWLRLWCRSAV